VTQSARLCERLCAACGHHHAHDYGGVCYSGDKQPIKFVLNACPCPHKHGAEGSTIPLKRQPRSPEEVFRDPPRTLSDVKALAREFYFFGRECADEAGAEAFERLWNDEGEREDLRARLEAAK